MQVTCMHITVLILHVTVYNFYSVTATADAKADVMSLSQHDTVGAGH